VGCRSLPVCGGTAAHVVLFTGHFLVLSTCPRLLVKPAVERFPRFMHTDTVTDSNALPPCARWVRDWTLHRLRYR